MYNTKNLLIITILRRNTLHNLGEIPECQYGSEDRLSLVLTDAIYHLLTLQSNIDVHDIVMDTLHVPSLHHRRQVMITIGTASEMMEQYAFTPANPEFTPQNPYFCGSLRRQMGRKNFSPWLPHGALATSGRRRRQPNHPTPTFLCDPRYPKK